jgi:hypothetical protein
MTLVDPLSPRRVVSSCAVVLVTAVAVATARAAPPSYVSLPSPIAPLSLAPPLGGGATASAEGRRHRVAARTTVDVAIDATGRPFAITATQRLAVTVAGDYYFVVGAPLLDVAAAPGSASTPGLRSGSIIWAGFNPDRRLLAARATLEPAAATPALPLGIETAGGRTTLVNTTGVSATGYDADAPRGPLLRYLRQLRAALRFGRTPISGGTNVTSTPRPVTYHVVAPLMVTGTVGAVHVSRMLTDKLTINSTGPVHLSVRTSPPVFPRNIGTFSGRRLLKLAITATLTAARVRQYETFLGNPDPAGSSTTQYTFRSAAPPAQVAASPATRKASSNHTLLLIVALFAAASAGLLVWARS